MAGIPLRQCPTCLLTEVEIDGNTHGWVNGTYRYRSREYECDCQTQMDLRRHYMLANIGDQYMRLDWKDFRGSDAAKVAVADFLLNWPYWKLNGMGLEFSSPNLGVGKTFAATYVGKELIKRGETVYFCPFRSVVRTLSEKADDSRLRESTVLILDEVGLGTTHAMNDLYEFQFEEIIRHRTNFNLVTIITTNILPSGLRSEYPRAYSLLEAKQIRVEMNGDDARQTFIADENLELVANNEVRPIT